LLKDREFKNYLKLTNIFILYKMHKRRRQIWRYPYYTQAALFLLQWTAQGKAQ